MHTKIIVSMQHQKAWEDLARKNPIERTVVFPCSLNDINTPITHPQINSEKQLIRFNSKEINNLVHRYTGNPILVPDDVNKAWANTELRVNTVHNAGITSYNGELIMPFRSHLLSGPSVLGKAVSLDGITWQVDDRPAMMPATEKTVFAAHIVSDKSKRDQIIRQEAGGVEDPRVIKIGESYYITYSAYDAYERDNVRIHLAKTGDFQTYIRYGAMELDGQTEIDMRNVTIFPEIINGKYYALIRPNGRRGQGDVGAEFARIQLAYTDDIESNKWQAGPVIMETEHGPSPFQCKIGPCAPPIKTKYGWLSIFHGVRTTMSDNPYVLGVMFHDLNDPAKVKVAGIPILWPTEADAILSPDQYWHVNHVIFCCGALGIKGKSGDVETLYIYYAGKDTVMNLGIASVDVLAKVVQDWPMHPITGEPLYSLSDMVPQGSY
ncbi:hypothetical protein ACFL57_00015 [Candidatus Margulisiibacteriota bacterium]